MTIASRLCPICELLRTQTKIPVVLDPTGEKVARSSVRKPVEIRSK